MPNIVPPYRKIAACLSKRPDKYRQGDGQEDDQGDGQVDGERRVPVPKVGRLISGAKGLYFCALYIGVDFHHFHRDTSIRKSSGGNSRPGILMVQDNRVT
jgi:hypothetical protein